LYFSIWTAAWALAEVSDAAGAVPCVWLVDGVAVVVVVVVVVVSVDGLAVCASPVDAKVARQSPATILKP
jgi:hypothetical protein